MHLAVRWWGELWRAFERRLFFFSFHFTPGSKSELGRLHTHTTGWIRLRDHGLSSLVATIGCSLRNLSASCVIPVLVSVFQETCGYFLERFLRGSRACDVALVVLCISLA